MKLDRGQKYPLYEITSSPMTSIVNIVHTANNPYRIEHTLVMDQNYVKIEVLDLKDNIAKLVVAMKGKNGEIFWEKIRYGRRTARACQRPHGPVEFAINKVLQSPWALGRWVSHPNGANGSRSRIRTVPLVPLRPLPPTSLSAFRLVLSVYTRGPNAFRKNRHGTGREKRWWAEIKTASIVMWGPAVCSGLFERAAEFFSGIFFFGQNRIFDPFSKVSGPGRCPKRSGTSFSSSLHY